MFFVFIILLNIFPPDWELIEKALQVENQDKLKAMEIYKKYLKRNDTIGVLSNYKMVYLDEKDPYFWFLNLLKKKPSKEIIQDAFSKLIEDKNEKAIKNYYTLRKNFSVKFRNKIEEKIFLFKYENSKEKLEVIKEALNSKGRAPLILSKIALKENIKIPDEILKKIFILSLKNRDLEFCENLIEKYLKNQKLGKEENFLLGRFYFFKKDYGKALYYFGLNDDEKSLFQKARVYLYLQQEDKALEILKGIKNNLQNEALYLILRVYLKNGQLQEAEELLDLIKKNSIKNKAALNMAIHYNFYGKKEEAKKVLSGLRENNEIKFWKNRFEGNINLSFDSKDSPFNFFFIDKYPFFQNEEIPLNLDFKPINFPQFLILKGFIKEGLFFKETLKFEPEFLSKIYISQKRYKNAINSIYPEVEKVLKRDVNQWDPEVLKIYFPRAYEEEVKKLCKEYGVPANLFWAIMRQESLFEEDAVSPEGALGLMQILPQNYIRYSEDTENPFQIEKNMRVSLKYLKELKEILGDWVYVISAYNAGEEAVLLWIKDPVAADIPSFYSTIPFQETKIYTRNVLYNWLIYNILYGREDENL